MPRPIDVDEEELGQLAPMGRSRLSGKVQSRFQVKLLITATREADGNRQGQRQAQPLVRDGQDRQVDDHADRADDGELEKALELARTSGQTPAG